MSDFIGRVAARAVGERAGASPRVPSRFEASGAGHGAALDVIDEEVIAHTPARATSGVHAAPRRPGKSSVSSAGPALQHGETAIRVGGEDRFPREGAAHASTRKTGEPFPDLQATTPAPAPPRMQQTERAPAATAIASPVLTRALPVASRPPAHAISIPAAVPAEPAVRVHIGRLEVRANLQEQLRRPEHPPVARPQELSLSDYLRGRREDR